MTRCFGNKVRLWCNTKELSNEGKKGDADLNPTQGRASALVDCLQLTMRQKRHNGLLSLSDYSIDSIHCLFSLLLAFFLRLPSLLLERIVSFHSKRQVFQL